MEAHDGLVMRVHAVALFNSVSDLKIAPHLSRPMNWSLKSDFRALLLWTSGQVVLSHALGAGTGKRHECVMRLLEDRFHRAM